MEMQDRAVIVTGGASGIGKATALLLAREGARVFIGDIDEAGGRGRRGAGRGRRARARIPAARPDRQPDSIDGFAAAVHDGSERGRRAGQRRRLGPHPAVYGKPAGDVGPADRDQPAGRDAADPRGAAADDRGARRQDRQHLERCRAGRQHRRDRLRRGEGRADRLYQIAGARDGALPYQRQLRLPRPDRHAAVPGAARAHARGADPGDPVPPHRPARGNRRGGACSFWAAARITLPARC